jgi:hypothetical protein
MDVKDQNKHRRLELALLITLLLLFAVVYNRRLIAEEFDPHPAQQAQTPGTRRASVRWNKVHADSAINLVRNGDLVLRSGSDEISAVFKKANTKDKSYSHAGIVFIENGYPFVYNCTGTAADPKALLKRDSLQAFVSPAENMAFAVYRYKLSSDQADKLHAIAIQYFKERRQFDPYFDLATDSSLYCTEFIYKAMIAATGDKQYFPVTHTPYFNYVAVDNLFLRRDIRLICRIGYIQ